MHALVRLNHIAAANSFTTAKLYPRVLAALASGADRYTRASPRYNLSKLRAKGLIEELRHSRRYRDLSNGYWTKLVRRPKLCRALRSRQLSAGATP